MKFKSIRLKTRFKVSKRKLENFIYKRIIKSIMFTSRLGRRTIFGYADSGLNFDKIYLNIPKGYNKFGTFVEKLLLNLPAAKATRNRQKVLKKLINDEINKNISLNKKTRILDVASGPARYLLELINEENKMNIEVLCLDLDKYSLRFGKKLAKNYPVRFAKANVFNLNRYKTISNKTNWKANIILASGLYFYYKDEKVIGSFNEAINHIENGGLFIFDNLIGNPNKKLLAKIGTTKNGKRWEFYYRNPEQIITWLKRAGFHNIQVINDKWDMYIIYRARKSS